ncbi:MAG: glycosyl hydrolase 115 family protein, partial [Treponema sp.]|nr:glycosyl hydrolase 115 family protein [Treponema sp.]
MSSVVVYEKGSICPFAVEGEAHEGVKKIAQKVAKDFEKVCGTLPRVAAEIPHGSEAAVLFATLGKSPLLDALIGKGKFDPSAVSGKNEVYQIKIIDNPFDGVAKALVVCGSDKRGTIYGMFAVSEFIGVSPLHFWGDAEPESRERIEIGGAIEIVSKEPSVKYRGFFINDEWPCFGNWTFSRFGGFTAEMYDHVFELLLRLKGNYIWPAMWTSSFALDGPGNLNEELADMYGVVVGASHHEPCLRASEEWDIVRGPHSEYGNEWNYYTNKDGLLKYWEEGLKRSGKYERIITIGMRGERDSKMLGENSTIKDNVDLLKDIINNQRGLIKKYVRQSPQLLALYKEVEEYFYGSDEFEGLKDWDGLEDVICMLCEDNFGFMRSLPTQGLGNRKFGMYYHFDYHGGPNSYEWMPSISYERTWEQMCNAYEYGIKEVWIVNVGDLKFNEVPLAYFMDMAYDFEKWGTANFNSAEEYTSLWLKKNFPQADLALRSKMAKVLHGYIKLNAQRRPEATNSQTYHPCHYLEADRMLDAAAEIKKVNDEIYAALSGPEKDAYYSMIYFPAEASINLLRMHLYAGKNMHFAKQGKKVANKFALLAGECIEKDRALMNEFAGFKSGKWKGMELEQHIGFNQWNEDNCRYPLRVTVEPAYKPRMVVSRKDSEKIFHKTYGRPMTLAVNDFMSAGNDEVIIEIANDGIGSLDYAIEAEGEYDWLAISSRKGTVEFQEDIAISCNREKLSGETKTARLFVKDAETVVAIVIMAKARHSLNLPPMTFLENNGIIVMEANHFAGKKDAAAGRFAELKHYGRSGAGMKVFPATANFSEAAEKPVLSYRFFAEE